MNLHELPKTVDKSLRRLGRGTSSGRGKTSGRGMKGDKARGRSPWYKAGGSRRSRLIKNLPQLRGIGNSPTYTKPIILSLSDLDGYFKSGETVSLATLQEKGIVSVEVRDEKMVKVLAKGSLTKSLDVQIPTSKAAAQSIEKVRK